MLSSSFLIHLLSQHDALPIVSSDLLTALSAGVTPRRPASAAAWAFTALWSVIMVAANLRTSVFWVRTWAYLASSMSMVLAVTATWATSGSDRSGAGAWAESPAPAVRVTKKSSRGRGFRRAMENLRSEEN